MTHKIPGFWLRSLFTELLRDLGRTLHKMVINIFDALKMGSIDNIWKHVDCLSIAGKIDLRTSRGWSRSRFRDRNETEVAQYFIDSGS